jgi:hypothetical protein
LKSIIKHRGLNPWLQLATFFDGRLVKFAHGSWAFFRVAFRALSKTHLFGFGWQANSCNLVGGCTKLVGALSVPFRHFHAGMARDGCDWPQINASLGRTGCDRAARLAPGDKQNTQREASMSITHLSQVGFGGAALLGVLAGLACVVLATVVSLVTWGSALREESKWDWKVGGYFNKRPEVGPSKLNVLQLLGTFFFGPQLLRSHFVGIFRTPVSTS